MSTVNIQATHICGGGEHAVLNVSLNGAAPEEMNVALSEIQGALSKEHRESIMNGICRLAIIGLTPAQAKQKFQAGFTVTI